MLNFFKRLFQRRAAYSLTHTRRMINILDPKPSDICIDDIAWALARTCRWNGHTDHHASTAQHAVMVAIDVESRCDGQNPLLVLGALHHDSEEYLFPDVNGQVKSRYKLLVKDSDRMSRVIYSAFGIPWALRSHPMVVAADKRALALEARDEMGDAWRPEAVPDYYYIDSPVRDVVAPKYEPWPWDLARDRFIAYHNALMVQAIKQDTSCYIGST